VLDRQKLYSLRRVFFGSGFTGAQSNGNQYKRMYRVDTLLKTLNIKIEGMHPNRAKLLEIIGLTEAETKPKNDLIGSLDELKASNLRRGPFKIELTDQPWAHLTFTRSHGRSTIRLLKLESIIHLYTPQRTAIAR